MSEGERGRRDVEAFLPLKPAVFHVLLALRDGEMHGYGIMKAVEEATQGQVRINPSPLYRRLKRLLEQGIVRECDAPEELDDTDERRRYYGLTKLGRRVLAEEAARVVALSQNGAVQRLAAKAK